MRDRFGIYSKPSRFILVFGGAFGVIFTVLRAVGAEPTTGNIVMLLVTGIIAGALWGAGMWLFWRHRMKPMIERRTKKGNLTLS